MKSKHLVYILISLLFFSCEKKYEAPVPDTNWDEYSAAGTFDLDKNAGERLQGIYTISFGEDMFGGSAALKWVWTIENSDTIYSLSGFFAKDNSYFIASGRQTDSVILLNGYYRKMINTETGVVRMKINYSSGAAILFDPSVPVEKDSIVITGNFGPLVAPLDSIKLVYDRPLKDDSDFLILAHRCGGRTADLLPASENSVKMVLLSPKLGATGIELDVRLTSDYVPVVYHDETLNDRLIQPNGMMGAISNYSFLQLRDLVRLTDGQQIPTLREILDAVLLQTDLRFVWIDLKYYGNLQPVRDIQREYELKAQQLNRDLEIVLGIPDDEVQQHFSELPDFLNIPSLNERYDEIGNVNSLIWGAPWSLGVMRTEVEGLHSMNRKAFAWTMDTQEYIEDYISEDLYDGILSNYPCTVAYCFYADL